MAVTDINTNPNGGTKWSDNNTYGLDSEIETAEGSNIIRIVNDNNIICGIELDELSKELGDTPSGVDGKTTEQVSGSEFPIIRINDRVMTKSEISGMKISSIDIIPTLSLTLQFEDSRFIHRNPIKDGDMVSIYIRADENNLIKYIRNDYIITSSISKKSGTGYKVIIDGKLFVDGLESNSTKGYIGTSKEVIKSIAKDLKLGFAFNDFDDTDDLQNWIVCRDTKASLIRSITNHSWKDEMSFFETWIDFYYNLTMINVNKMLLSEENPEDVDITLLTNTTDIRTKNGSTLKGDNQVFAPKLLTNMTEYGSTPFYISKWKPINNSSTISMNSGYQENTHTFIHNQKILNFNSETAFETLVNIPAYDQNKTNEYIILRGRTKFDPNDNTGEMERVNYNMTSDYTRDIWCGVEYMKGTDETDIKSTDTWSGNLHKNYSRSEYHNKINKNELDKIYIEVECDGLCLQILRGERVPVVLIFEGPVEREFNNRGDENDSERLGSRFYSGHYFVDSVEYEYKPKMEYKSSYKTRFVLKRREWPTPEDIQTE